VSNVFQSVIMLIHNAVVLIYQLCVDLFCC